MSKRRRETTIEDIILELNIKRPKLETIMLARKRTFKKRKREGNLSAQVNRILDKRIESKFISDQLAVVDLLANPQFIDISAMTQGVTESTRVGNQIQPTYIEVKFACNAPAGNVITPFIRVMIVQSRGGPLLVGDLPGAYGGLIDPDVYNIFHDRIYMLRSSGGDAIATTSPGFVFNWSSSTKLSGMKRTVQYNTTTAASDQGGWYLFVIAGDADIDLDDGYTFMRYKDA